MIEFKYIYYRNFLRTGNSGIKVFLDKSSTTLISGRNGEGKSSVLDQITFSIFGKSYRGIPKPNLVNSINGRDMLTEISFDIGTDSYIVRRGIKPHIFQIEKNGKVLDQEGQTRDQQKYLESQILKMSYKAFCQVQILGSASYTPFMQLPTGERRRVIEQILDIGVFSDMYQILRGKISSWKERYAAVDSEIALVEQKIKMQMSFMKKLKDRSEEGTTKKKEEMEAVKNSLVRLKQEYDSVSSEIDKLHNELAEASKESLVDLYKRRRDLTKDTTQIKTKLTRAEKDKRFFEDNSVCGSCLQEIQQNHKDKQQKLLEAETQEMEKQLLQTQTHIIELESHIDHIEKLVKNIESKERELQQTKGAIQAQMENAKKLKGELSSVTEDNSAAIQKEKEILLEQKQKHDLLWEEKKKLLSDKEVLDSAILILKDDGVKQKIIKQYIPIINKQVNKYLASMNFFVKFHIDENFNETLKSRHRDDFTYNSFSMGERQRIDLALLFAWREVARMKNSVNCNLLIFDEVFDSSLDQQGTDDLLQILDTLDHRTRVFVISHKNLLEDKFRSSITFEKVKDFTRIQQTGV